MMDKTNPDWWVRLMGPCCPPCLVQRPLPSHQFSSVLPTNLIHIHTSSICHGDPLARHPPPMRANSYES
eukprot:jgi/Mesvir1/7232/Mv25798-RA.1